MTRLLVGMLRRARRLLAEANARGGGEGGAQVGGGVAAGGPSVASASDAAHALLRAVQAVQRQHAALALFTASRQPLSFASPAARALLLKHSQHYGDGTEHGVGAEGGRVPSPGVSTATWAFWAQGGYPARLLDPSLVEALCPAPLTEPTATPSPVQASTKRTYQPSLLIRKRRHGFLARLGTATGRRVLLNRRIKSRRKLSA